MIFLKELNLQDAEKEYQYIVSVPADENGFINDFSNAPRENFETAILQPLICQGQGMDLPKDMYRRPTTCFGTMIPS